MRAVTGKKYDGTKPSDHRRSLQPRALAVADRTRNAELILQPVADFEYSVLNHSGLFAAFALKQQESASRTQLKKATPRSHASTSQGRAPSGGSTEEDAAEGIAWCLTFAMVQQR